MIWGKTNFENDWLDMVALCQSRGIRDERTLQALREIPRHEFVGPSDRFRAYADGPLPIGFNQTISQPYIVAFMTAALELTAGDRVLEIGTGSGYQTAILAKLCRKVISVERVEELAEKANATLKRLRISNVEIHCADGFDGWSPDAPYEGILVAAAPESIPEALTRQLAPGGRMVLPVGSLWQGQDLWIIRKTAAGRITSERSLAVRFVPLIPSDS